MHTFFFATFRLCYCFFHFHFVVNWAQIEQKLAQIEVLQMSDLNVSLSHLSDAKHALARSNTKRFEWFIEHIMQDIIDEGVYLNQRFSGLQFFLINRLNLLLFDMFIIGDNDNNDNKTDKDLRKDLARLFRFFWVCIWFLFPLLLSLVVSFSFFLPIFGTGRCPPAKMTDRSRIRFLLTFGCCFVLNCHFRILVFMCDAFQN